jgi:hypothetical protein
MIPGTSKMAGGFEPCRQQIMTEAFIFFMVPPLNSVKKEVAYQLVGGSDDDGLSLLARIL